MKFWRAIGLILVLSAVGLTYEIAAGRVLAPYYGTSLLTWTTVIAVVLAGFSLGSAWGGVIADRPRAAALSAVRVALIATAVLMALSPALLGFLHGSGARGTGGMVLSTLVAFFPASVGITLPSPLLTKLAIEARPGREGASLGLALAAGSAGAIGGAVLAGFVALPLVGSVATFAGCAALTLGCLPVLRGGAAAPPVAVIGAAGFIGLSALVGTPVCDHESGLSCLHVERRGGEVRLFSDRTLQAAEPLDEGDDLAIAYTRWIGDRLEQDTGADARVLFVGGGGYTLPSRLVSDRPAARATAVEIDPLVTAVVRANLPRAAAVMDAAADRFEIVHADGRVFLNESAGRFDAAVMDAFSSASVPAHLVTVEAFERVRAITDGPVYVNLIDRADGPLARGVHAILTELWPHVVAVQGPVSLRGRANVLLAASDRPLAPLATLPEGYAPTRITPARAFTDDRGWVGHR
ncbi:fused MFS/spermidine synthase [Wenxinia marina]|uniref:Spermidine synthase n=1 Tax=Wenxinia marina DSM 24838 TaxID=1123501 RepID=A0A0D0NQK4_9RHOB|nr:fused MFS/spermidine synthase [Wenxinia marina]KIQ70550.1 Spermidine synthase [Wenxinia marina DSM 24838]GGL52210.1 hypothetical protein GCM10011392_03220 [Wenxinia marina]